MKREFGETLQLVDTATRDDASTEPQELAIDGKQIFIHAEDKIVLTCGKASITLTKAGKIIIKGEYVLSSSSGENRIIGGSVSIN